MMKVSRRNSLGGLAVAGAVVSPMVASAVAEVTGASTGSKRIGLLVHFSDNDYAETVMHHLKAFKGLHAELLMRSYVYVDYQKELPHVFSKVHAAENRTQVLSDSQVVVSCCTQAVAEASGSGAKVVFLATDQTTAAERSLAETLGATVISHQDGKALHAAIRAV